MDNFLAFLMGLVDFISDFFQYIIHELTTDRRKLLQAIMGLLLVILCVVGIRSVISHSRKNAQIAATEPDTQMVLPIVAQATVSPEPEEAPAQESSQAVTAVSSFEAVAPGASATAGNYTMVNEYLQKKSRQMGTVAPNAATGTASTNTAATVQSTAPVQATGSIGSGDDDEDGGEEEYDEDDDVYHEYDYDEEEEE